MNSVTSRRFRELYAPLPAVAPDIYFVRVSLGYRALGQMTGTDIVWFWIGSHADYDKLL